jgi:hypothetical protein
MTRASAGQSPRFDPQARVDDTPFDGDLLRSGDGGKENTVRRSFGKREVSRHFLRVLICAGCDPSGLSASSVVAATGDMERLAFGGWGSESIDLASLSTNSV